MSRTHDYFCPRCESWHGGLGEPDPEVCSCGFPCCWYDLNNEGFDGAPEWWPLLEAAEAKLARVREWAERCEDDGSKYVHIEQVLARLNQEDSGEEKPEAEIIDEPRDVIEAAIDQDEVVNLTVFVEKHVNEHLRTISPWSIDDDLGLVTGWDHYRRGIRSFHLGGIRNVSVNAAVPYQAEHGEATRYTLGD